MGLVTDDPPKTRQLLEQFISEYGLSERKRVGKMAFGGFIPSSGAVKNTYSDGLMLVGDAAGFTSPMFEGGTSLAMTSGKFAAEVALQVISNGDTSQSALAAYESLWKAEFPDYSKLVAAKESVYKFNDAEWDRIGSLIPRDLTTISTLHRLQIGANAIIREPGIFMKGFVPAMEALGKSRAKHYGW